MNSVLTLNLPSPVDRPEQAESSSYRFVTNIASADLDRARQAAQSAGPAGVFRLVPITCSELGLPLKGGALYVLNQMSEPETFWKLFHSLAPSRSRRNDSLMQILFKD